MRDRIEWVDTDGQLLPGVEELAGRRRTPGARVIAVGAVGALAVAAGVVVAANHHGTRPRVAAAGTSTARAAPSSAPQLTDALVPDGESGSTAGGASESFTQQLRNVSRQPLFLSASITVTVPPPLRITVTATQLSADTGDRGTDPAVVIDPDRTVLVIVELRWDCSSVPRPAPPGPGHPGGPTPAVTTTTGGRQLTAELTATGFDGPGGYQLDAGSPNAGDPLAKAREACGLTPPSS